MRVRDRYDAAAVVGAFAIGFSLVQIAGPWWGVFFAGVSLFVFSVAGMMSEF